MAHHQQVNFCTAVLNQYPDLFKDKKVLDMGSFDVNGNNRYLFSGGSYIGVDAGPGKNVDVVSLAHEYNDPDSSFDVVVSTEMLEHDMYWRESLLNMLRLLKSGGMLLITCAGEGREEHGTIRQVGHWHPAFAHQGFNEYYKNLNEEDFREVFDCDTEFSQYKFEDNPESCDTYFYGIKR